MIEVGSMAKGSERLRPLMRGFGIFRIGCQPVRGYERL